MKRAEQVVAALLEDAAKPRFCKDCVLELGLHQAAQQAGAEYSGGQCKRHFAEFLRKNRYPEAEIQAALAENPDAWPPDLSAPSST